MAEKQGASDSGFHFMQDYLRCQQYFYWKFFMRLDPLWLSPSIMFGDAMHAGLEAWYTGLKQKLSTPARHTVAIGAFARRLCELAENYKYTETYRDDQDRGKRVLDRYAMEYAFEDWMVLDVERTLEYTLESGDRFTGRFDLAVLTQQGRRYIVDHKTTGWSLGNLIRTLNATDQSTGYLWLWNNAAPAHLKANGIVFNIIRTYKDSIDCKRHLVTKGDKDLERFKLDAQATLQEIANKVADPIHSRFTRNTGSCFLYNRPCEYLDLCAGVNYEGLIGTTYKPRKEETI